MFSKLFKLPTLLIMKTNPKNLFAALLVGVVFISCEPSFNPENCSGEDSLQIETFYNEEFQQFPCAIQLDDESFGIRNFIIKSQEEFENIMSCNAGSPLIDFNEYFVLAGRFRYKDSASLQSQSVIICDNRLVYNVEIQKSILNSITNTFYYLVISREYINYEIIFNVN